MTPLPDVRPSFAREALSLLGKGQAERALQLAADGVRMYPTYLGGYIALADAYAALGDLDDAGVILNEADRRFPGFRIVTQRRQQYTTVPTEPAPSPEPEFVPTFVQRRRPTEYVSTEPEQRSSPIRVINLAQPVSDTRVIRSASMRLIPGLEFTSLRFEGSKTRGSRSIQFLPDPPSFREFHKPGRNVFGPPPTVPQRRVSLEELADKIGRVRLTAEELEKRPPAPDPFQEERHSLVTETLARIYMSQKSYDKAVEAFAKLQQQHPEQQEKFQTLIDECKKLQASVA